MSRIDDSYANSLLKCLRNGQSEEKGRQYQVASPRETKHGTIAGPQGNHGRSTVLREELEMTPGRIPNSKTVETISRARKLAQSRAQPLAQPSSNRLWV